LPIDAGCIFIIINWIVPNPSVKSYFLLLRTRASSIWNTVKPRVMQLILRKMPPHFIYLHYDFSHRLYTANNFPFMCFQKWFSQASLLISTKYFKNRIIMFCVELWYSVEKYITRCSHSTVSIGNNMFKNVIIKLRKYRRFMHPDYNYKDSPFNLLLPYLKCIFGIWDWCLAN
jgi:hypothetical protein